MRIKELVLLAILILTMVIVGIGTLIFVVNIGKEPNAPFRLDLGTISEIAIFLIVTLVIFRPAKSKSI